MREPRAESREPRVENREPNYQLSIYTHIMIRRLLILALFISSVGLSAQTINFTLEVDKDTLQTGEYITVTYTLTGARGEFVAPEFDDFRLVGGPNFSSQISIVNGRMDQTFTYSYVFQVIKMGDFIIPEASVTVDGELYISPSAKIHATENNNWNDSQSAPILPKKRKSVKDRKVTDI